MLYTIPDYYKEFRCTAGECEDTCCAGWQIMIDERSWKRYKRVRGRFGRRLRRSMDKKTGAFRQSEDKRCAFLNQENLCDLYTALGPKSLCRTCRQYPRHIEEFENVREISLSVSCPEVARIVLTRKKPAEFLNYEKEGEEEFDDFDPFLYSVLEDARETMFEILKDREKDLSHRVQIILQMAEEIQENTDQGELFSCGEVIDAYAKGDFELKDLKMEAGERYAFSKRMFACLHRLEKLKDDWEPYLRETEELLFAKGKDFYQTADERFKKWLEKSSLLLEIKQEQLIIYFLYTYFCGAVYDGEIYEKVQMSVISVFLIREMLFAAWMRNEEALDLEDVVGTVYRYSREIEHSDQNLELVQRLFCFAGDRKPCASDGISPLRQKDSQ